MSFLTVGADAYLSYSGRKSYLTCPKQYEHHYILDTPSDRSPRDSLFGSVIGKLFEWFYEKQLWALPDPAIATLALSEEAINQVYTKEKWEEHQDPYLSAQIREDLRKYVPTGIEII